MTERPFPPGRSGKLKRSTFGSRAKLPGMGRSMAVFTEKSSTRTRHQTHVDVDLASTKEQFGLQNPADFDPNKVIREHFIDNGVNNALPFRKQLERRRNLASEELKQIAEGNYEQFIATSKQITAMEADMLQLHSLFNAYQGKMKTLAEVHFDTGYQPRSRARTRHATPATLDAEGGLEEMAEDIRSLMFERKWDKAVSAAETALEKLQEQRGEGGGEDEDSEADSDEDWETDDGCQDETDTDVNGLTGKLAVEDSVRRLVALLADDLRDPHARPFESRQLVQFLNRLGHHQLSLDILLDKRSQSIREAIRQIRFQGDIVVYSQQLSQVVFPAIGAAVVELARLFESPRFMSHVLLWAVSELEPFARNFERQVLRSIGDNRTYFNSLGTCLKHVFEGCATLEKKGVSLCSSLHSALLPALLAIVEGHMTQLQQTLLDSVLHEDWVVKEYTVGLRDFPTRAKLTSSGISLYAKTGKLLKELNGVLLKPYYVQAQPTLYQTIVRGVCTLFESYLTLMAAPTAELEAHSLSDAQHLAIVANAYYLGEDLLKVVSQQLARTFGHPVIAIDVFRAHVVQFHGHMQWRFCSRRANLWIQRFLNWSKGEHATERYGGTAVAAAPSTDITALMRHLLDFAKLVVKSLSIGFMPSLLRMCVEELFSALSSLRYWRHAKLSVQGLHQLALDLAFVRGFCGDFVTPRAKAVSLDICDKASKLQGEGPEVLKSASDYDDMLGEALKAAGVDEMRAVEAQAEKIPKEDLWNPPPPPAKPKSTSPSRRSSLPILCDTQIPGLVIAPMRSPRSPRRSASSPRRGRSKSPSSASARLRSPSPH